MPLLIIISPFPGDGKSTVAAGLAGALARRGAEVRLVRLPDGRQPDSDAEAFTHVAGVRSDGSTLGPDSLHGVGELAVVETGDPEMAVSMRMANPDAAVVLVTRYGVADDASVERLRARTAAIGVIVTAAPAGRSIGTALGQLPQDRVLAAPAVRDLAAALEGESIGPAEPGDETVAWLEIGPITAQPGLSHFARHGEKAVITRADKPDVALAALDTETVCLILTGGQRPLPYVLERAAGEEIPVILTAYGTVAAVERLGGLYGRSAFVGRRKAARAVELSEAHLDLAALEQRLSLHG